MAQKPKRYKGCCMLCADWIRGDGRWRRHKASELRKLGGQRRAFKHRARMFDQD